jgi:hypothetical protein
MKYTEFDNLRIGDHVISEDGSHAIVLKKSNESDEVLIITDNGDKMWVRFYVLELC